MKLGIVGCRYFKNYNLIEAKIDEYIKDNNITIHEIVSGAAEGIDTIAELYSKKHNIKFTCFPPDTQKYGIKAYAIRNKLIVDNSDQILAFPSIKSKGTFMTINIAKKENKPVAIIKI